MVVFQPLSAAFLGG